MEKEHNFLEKILLKIFYFKSRISRNPMESNKICKKNFLKFNYKLTQITNISLERHHRLRYLEIHNLINFYKLKNVVEIGTGRTTFFFNSISNIKTLSFEQDQKWLDIINPLLLKSGIYANITLLDVERYKEGGRFANLKIDKCDLLYIDGPYVKKNYENQFKTFNKKAAYYDFETIFDRGIFPKVIMIEGRTSTVDEIRRSKHSKKYEFYGEFIYALQRKKWLEALNFRRHSIFVKKSN